MTDFPRLIGALAGEGVDYVIVGGLAATIHGSSRLTEDIDVVYSRSDENLSRIQRALAPHRPYPRGAPEGLPFEWSVATLRRGLNFTLATSLGSIDLFGEVPGGGTFENLRPHCRTVHLFGHDCLCLDLPRLVDLKRAAGRPKDLEVLAELEALREEAEGGA